MSVTGIDVPIALIRDELANVLWTDVSNRVFYAKCYRNEKVIQGSKQLIPEIYTEQKEYKEVLFDDRYNVSVFFDAREARTDIYEKPEGQISIIFAVNLEALYPGETYRTSENALADVVTAIRNARGAFSYSSLEATVGLNAYGDFYRDNVKKYDMHPYHTFRVDMDVSFDYCGDDYISTQLREGGFVYPFPIIFTS